MTLHPSQSRAQAQQAAIGFAVCMCLVLKQLAGVVACLCLATGSPAQAVHQGEHAHLDGGGHAHEVHATGDCVDDQDCSRDEDCHSEHSCDQHLPHSLGDHEGVLGAPDSSGESPTQVLAWLPSNADALHKSFTTGFRWEPLSNLLKGPPPPRRQRPRAPPLS